jgi:serine/threonine protein kinase/Flp pilus assembly protein TadD
MADELLGREISHYLILEKLGEGGMGVVYRAKDLLLRRQVALKFLKKDLEADEDARARFQREAQAASSLNHPNICTIHEVGEFEGHPYLVMELIEGQTLRERISCAALSTEEVAAFGIQLADALESAHSKRIIHRDIKPANIFLTPRGQVKLLDFGLARLLHKDLLDGSTKSDSPLTESNAVVGTLFYVAPEVLRREPADARSDLWSLGVVFYEMAAGRHPFPGQTLFQVTSAILREPPRPLPQSVPDGLRRVILRCLAKNPVERYQHASEARAALETIRASKEGLSDPQIRTADFESIRSIAVIPFHNQSNDPEADYLSWGITESLIYSLGQLEKLHVAPASSVHRYKGQAPDPRRLGRDLNVGAVVTGRVTARGDQLVVGTELVDTQSGWQIWGRQYSRKAADLVSIHEEIAREISQGLRLSLTRDEKQRLEKPATHEPAAYQLYLQGRFSFNSKDENGLKRALRYFSTAVRKDPAFALAQVGVADAYFWLAFFGVLPPHECFPKAREAESKACELDPELGEAHASRACVAFGYLWDMASAEREFRRAIELSPRYAAARYWHAWYLAAAGRFQEAGAEMEEVEKLEPASLLVDTYHAFVSYLAKQNGRAIGKLRGVLGKAPQFAVAHWWLGLALMEEGEYEGALESLQKAVQLSSGHPSPLASLGHLYARMGWNGDATKVDQQLTELSATRYVSAFDRAVCLAPRRDKDAALGWMEKACEERSVLLPYARVWPALNALRGESRFKAVVERLGWS